jgi:hypothetical protein
MIQRRSKFIILVTVLAVIIVAFPITFYEYNSKPVPIETTNSITQYVWKEPFLNCTGGSIFWIHGSSTTNISTTGYTNSALSISVAGLACNRDFSGWFLSFNGSLVHKLHPKSLIVCAYDPSSVFFGDRFQPILSNLSFVKYGTNYYSNNNRWSYGVYSFTNYGYSSSPSSYHFAAQNNTTYRDTNICINFDQFGMPFQAMFKVELTGLAKPVYAEVDIDMEES